MKNFLLFTLEFPPAIGGIATYYKNLTRFWNGSFFVLSDQIKGKKCISNASVSYRSLSSACLRPRYLPAFFHLASAVIQKKIKHVIVGQILPLGTITLYLSKIFGFKYSIILHGLDISLALRPEKKKLSLKILAGAKKIICANSRVADILKQADTSLETNIQVVNPGITNELTRDEAIIIKLKKKHSLAGKKVIFSLGRLVKRKGFDKMIEAFVLIVEKEKNVRLVIGGDGEDKKYLKSLINCLSDSLKEKIILTGEINEEEKNAWFEICNFFALPAREIAGDFEGFGIVYLEANLHGKAVLAGRSGGVEDAVRDGVSGLLVNPKDTEAIAQASLRLMQDKKLCEQMGEEGKKRALRDFNWQGQVEKIKKSLSTK